MYGLQCIGGNLVQGQGTSGTDGHAVAALDAARYQAPDDFNPAVAMPANDMDGADAGAETALDTQIMIEFESGHGKLSFELRERSVKTEQRRLKGRTGGPTAFSASSLPC